MADLIRKYFVASCTIEDPVSKCTLHKEIRGELSWWDTQKLGVLTYVDTIKPKARIVKIKNNSDSSIQVDFIGDFHLNTKQVLSVGSTLTWRFNAIHYKGTWLTPAINTKHWAKVSRIGRSGRATFTIYDKDDGNSDGPDSIRIFTINDDSITTNLGSVVRFI